MQLLQKLKTLYRVAGESRPSKTLEDFRDDLRVQAPSWSYQISECRKNGDPVAERMYRGFQLVDEQSLREIDAALLQSDPVAEFDRMFKSREENEFDSLFAPSREEAEFDAMFDPVAEFDSMFS
jgi:hypothetical protein